MKRYLLITLATCFALLYGGGGNFAWADDYYNVTRYSQNFETASNFNNGWTLVNGSAPVQTNIGNNNVIRFAQGGGSGDRSHYFTTATASTYFASASDYSFEFDYGHSVSNTNTTTTTIKGAGDATIFYISTPKYGTTSVYDASNNKLCDIDNDGYAKACPVKLNHFLLTSSSDGTYLTVKNSSGTEVLTATKIANGLVNISQIHTTLGKTVSEVAYDNIVLKEHSDLEAVTSPTFSITGVDGASRTITITEGTSSKGNTVVTYYTTDNSDPTTESTLYNGAFSVSENCTIKAVSISSTDIASEVGQFVVNTGIITLNQPTWLKTAYNNGTSTVILNTNQDNILLTPTAQIAWQAGSRSGSVENGGSITVNDGETLRIYSTATGYGNSETFEIEATAPYEGGAYWKEEYISSTDKVVIALGTETVSIGSTDYYNMLANDLAFTNHLFTPNSNINANFLYRTWGIYSGNGRSYAIHDLKAGQWISIVCVAGTEQPTITGGANLTADAWGTVANSTYCFYVNEDGDATISINRYCAIKSITVKDKNIPLYSYTVTAKSADGKVNSVIASAQKQESGVSYTVPFSKYINVDGTLYEAQPINDNGKAYSTTFTLDADKTIDITYAPTDIKNVVFLSEGEEIEGMTATDAGNVKVRCSNGQGGYSSTNDVTVTSLPAGNYKVSGFAWGNAGTNFVVSAGNNVVATFGTAASTVNVASSDIFNLKEETNITIGAAGSAGNSPKVLDFIYIQDMGMEHSYTVRGKIEELEVYEEIAKGDGYANDPAITIPVKKYIEKLGTLYEAQPIDDNYSITFTLGQDVDEVISYTKTTITNVTMFEECEDFTVEGNWAVRGMGNGNNVTYSQDMIGRLAKNSYAYSSPAYEETNYRVTIKGRNQAGSSAGTLELKLRDAEGNLSATIENLTWKAGENKELTSGVISIPVGSSVVFFNNSADYNSNIEMDYVYFQDRGGKISYKLNAVDKDGKLLQNLSEGYSFENEPIQVVTGYNKYVNVEGTLYEAKPNTDKAYLTEFYLTKDTVVNIVYEPTEINNVVYLSEAEGIANASSYDKANANVRCSNGKGAFFENDQAATSLTPGNYRIVGQVYGGDPEDDTKDWTFTISVGNDTIWSQRTTGSLTEHCDTFTIIEPADVIVNKGGKGVNGKDVALLDYIYIQNLGDENKFQLKAVSEDGAIDSLLATRTGYASDEAKYAYYPKYLEVNDTLYEAQPNEDGTYRVLYTTTANNTQTISYTKTDIEKVVFLTEAEAIEGVTAVEEGTCSDGKGAYAAEAATLTSLTAGYYKMAGALRGAEGTEFAVTVGNDTIWAAVTIADETAFAETEFELTEDATLTIAAAGDENALMDYFYIQVAEKQVEPEPEPEPEPDDYIDFTKSEGAKSTDENPEAGIVNDPMTLSGGSQIEAAEESALNLWGNDEDGTELRVAEGMSFYVTPPAGEKALHKIIIKGKALNLKASNGTLTEGEEETPEVEFETPQLLTEESAQARMANTTDVDEDPVDETEGEAEENAEETLVWTGNINKVKFTAEADTRISSIIVESEDADENTETYTEPEPQPEDELLTDAKTLLGDSTGVAAGKLIAAIDAYEQVEEKQDADKEALAAAMAQYENDNAAQENDQTAKVKTDGWKKYDGSKAGVCATQYAPAIDTYDGRKGVQLAEVYESTVATTGTIIYQDITGLQNGTYKVGFYGNAFFTSGRGFDSDMADGAEDVAYVFANDQKEFIVSNIATETKENNFRTFNVNVTDGAIKLGMGKEKPGTNWHTMQIYQLTWMASAKDVYANDLAALKAAIAVAKENQTDELKTEGKEALAAAIEAAEAAAESNMLNISELEAEVGKLAQAINDFQTANLVTFEGKYYIQHVASGKFMAAGHNWGTRGIVNAEGLDLTLTADDNKKVTIDSRVANNETNHFLGSGLYMDAGAFGWTIEKLSDDSYAIGDGTKYLTIDADDNLTLADEGASWKFVAAETLEAERLAANMATLAAATKDNGVDATFLIKTPQFNRNDQRNAENWTVSEDCTNKNLGGGSNDTQFNGCAESYHSTFTISQLVAGAPKGTYRMTAQGFYRQDGETTEATPLFFMNDATAEVPAKTGSENSMADAGTSFSAGEYTIEPIEVFVDEGGTLTVGIKNETAASQWIIFDNFRLTYFGEEDSTTPKLPTYTVNEVIDGQVVRTTEGQAELGATVKVPYRHFNVVDGKLYSKGATSKEYNYSFTFNEDGQTETISGYSATDIEGVVFLSEGEDIKGLTVNNTGNTAVRSSNSASAYAAEEDVEITKLPAGTYKLTAAIYDSAKNPNSMWYFIAGNDTIAKLNCTAVNYQEKSSEKFTLEAETSIKLAKGGSSTQGIDLVYIQAVEAETPIFSYTVNEVIGETVVRTTEGTDEKGATVKVPFREYNVADGKLYKKGQISKEFNYSFKLNSDAQVENLEYSATSVENVVFLKEGEDIEGLTKINSGNSAIRSSNSAAGYAAEGNVEFVTLPAGIYKLTAGIYDSSKTPDSHWKFLAGEQEIADLNCTVVNIQELTSDEFTLTEETKLYIAQGGSASMGIDFIYIVKTGEAIPDGISILKNAAEKGAVYDMQGRKQTGKLRTGLYIMDGKVISVK